MKNSIEEINFYKTRLKTIEEYFNCFAHNKSIAEVKKELNEATLLLLQEKKIEIGEE
jgi:predicted RNase H-like HicB family nuclease